MYIHNVSMYLFKPILFLNIVF